MPPAIAVLSRPRLYSSAVNSYSFLTRTIVTVPVGFTFLTFLAWPQCVWSWTCVPLSLSSLDLGHIADKGFKFETALWWWPFSKAQSLSLATPHPLRRWPTMSPGLHPYRPHPMHLHQRSPNPKHTHAFKIKSVSEPACHLWLQHSISNRV